MKPSYIVTEEVPRAFYVWVACEFCGFSTINLFPEGRQAVTFQEFPTDCHSCCQRGMVFVSYIVTTN